MLQPSMTYLWMITLNTGDGERCPRSSVHDDVVTVLRPILQDAAESGERRPVVPGPPAISLQISSAGAHMMGTIWDDGTDLPIVTMGVATRSRGAGRLWQLLHNGRPGLVTDTADVPRAPWCGVLVHPSSLVRHDVALWAADLERCIAWTWMEMRGDT